MYSYFDSKNAIYDAMFAQSAQQFVDEQRASMPAPDDPLEAIKAGLHFFVEFCAADFADASCCSSARSRGSSPRRNRSRSPRTTWRRSASCSPGAA